MQDTMTIDTLAQARGLAVYDSGEDKIGEVEEIFYDEGSGRPEWLGIGTGFFGTKRVLVPVEGAEMTEDGVYVRYSKSQVKDSPDIDSDEISYETESALRSYYGLGNSDGDGVGGEALDRGLPAGTADSPGDVEGGMPEVTRSEEELAVGKREVQAGRVRLRKWVETEPVQADVELQRETAEVRREPINKPVSPTEIGEEEVGVELRAEQAVVQKQAVAKERIGVETDVETERQTISDEVRKERVEVEGDTTTR